MAIHESHNSTAAHDVSPFHIGSLLRSVYSMMISVFPFRFSYVQQIHVKIKAEAAVAFAFHALKQVYDHVESWQAKWKARRLEAVRLASEQQKKCRKRKRNKKKRKQA